MKAICYYLILFKDNTRGITAKLSIAESFDSGFGLMWRQNIWKGQLFLISWGLTLYWKSESNCEVHCSVSIIPLISSHASVTRESEMAVYSQWGEEGMKYIRVVAEEDEQ